MGQAGRGELAFRMRSAEPEDLKALAEIRVSLAHPEARTRGSGLRTALQRGELMVLERSDPREKAWVIGGFIEWHMRVDDTMTLRDVGSVGEVPHAGIVKHLVGELLRSLAPAAATSVVRRDAELWNRILAEIAGFFIDGPPEYRRPHYYNIWKWSPESVRQAVRESWRGRGRR